MRDVRKILLALCTIGGWSITSVACGEPGPSIEAKPSQANACALLSPATISQAIGFPAHSGVRRDSGYEPNGSYSSTCVWPLERENFDTDRTAPLWGRSFVILNVMRWPEGSGLADSFLQAFHEAAARGEIPHEPAAREFGDAALWWGDGLAVRKDDVSFGISVVISGAAPGFPGEFEGRLVPEILRRLEHQIE